MADIHDGIWVVFFWYFVFRTWERNYFLCDILVIVDGVWIQWMTFEFSFWYSRYRYIQEKIIEKISEFSSFYIINLVDDFRALIWYDGYCAWYWNCILYNILKSKDTLVFSLPKFWIYLHGRLYSSFVPSDILKVVDYNWVCYLSDILSLSDILNTMKFELFLFYLSECSN